MCSDQAITKIVDFVPLSYKEAILNAMSREEQDKIYTRWSDAYPPAHDLAIKLNELEAPLRYIISHSRVTEKDPSSLYNTFCQIGGK